MRNALIIFLFFQIFIMRFAGAACTSPTGDAGHVTYNSSVMEYCNGSAWVDMTVGSALTACSNAGEMTYTGGIYKYCNGSSWFSMDGALNGAACTASGSMKWQNSQMQFCNGSYWRPMRAKPNYFAIGITSSPYLEIYDRTGWVKIPSPSTLPTAAVNAVQFSPDGSKLAVGYGASPYLIVYNTVDWSTVTLGTTPNGAITTLKWSPDGTRLAIGKAVAAYLMAYDTSTWNYLSSPTDQPAASPTTMAYSPDGTKLAVGWGGSGFSFVINTTLSPWAKIAGVTAVPGTPRGSDFSADGTRLAFTVNGGSNIVKLLVLQVSDWSTVHTITTTSSWRGAGFSPDGSSLYLYDSTGGQIKKYNTSTWSSSNVTNPLASIVGLIMSRDRSQYAVVSDTTSPYLGSIIQAMIRA